MKVIGLCEKTGNFQGTDYHNIMIHCTFESDEAYGLLSEVIKVKFANVREVFGKSMSSSDWQNLVGETIFVNYNRYGQVQAIILQPESVSK